MIEYDKITKEALYALAVELEQQIEAAEQEKADQPDTQAMIADLTQRATNAEELADYVRIERDSANVRLSDMQERLGAAGLAILEQGAANFPSSG